MRIPSSALMNIIPASAAAYAAPSVAASVYLDAGLSGAPVPGTHPGMVRLFENCAHGPAFANGSGTTGENLSATTAPARAAWDAVHALPEAAHREALAGKLAPFIGLDRAQPDLWEAALVIGRYYNDHQLTEGDAHRLISAIDRIREYRGREALTSTAPTTVIFGTSGWRDRIGEGFTVRNVHRTVRGIVEMMKSETFLKASGATSFDEVRKAGIVVFRDNRFMGDTFIDAAVKELAHAGIKVMVAGECPTGVGSALVTELRAAGSINFTPSHNPMDYAGIKFNPADGGPAAPEMTSIIEEKANALMSDAFVPAAPAAEHIEALVERIDAKTVFANFMERSEMFDVAATRDWLRAHKDELAIIVDNMHGSSRGYIEAVLGDDLVQELSEAGALRFEHTNDDVSFHGVKPEPSAANQRPLIEALAATNRRLTLAVALDPDADRIRFSDARVDMPMNLFGAVSFASLLQRGINGGIASSVPSSDFALEIAKQNGIPFYETPVGFKWFRPHLTSGAAMIAFEESDGISFRGHTLEKCALAGFFAALDVMMRNDDTLSSVYDKLQRRYGFFYPDRSGVDVKGVKPDEWKSYKGKVVSVLAEGLVKPGDVIEVGGEQKRVKEVNTTDGLKVVFADRSWILLRASGTEPKFRVYYEVVSKDPVDDIRPLMDAYAAAGSLLLARARERVNG